MSTQDTMLVEALKALQPAAEAIIKNRSVPFVDADYPPFQNLLDVPMREVLHQYAGTNSFLRDVRRKQPWTPRQSRAVAEILRRELRGETSRRTSSQDRVYKCFKCGEELVGKTALYDHKRNACPGYAQGSIGDPNAAPSDAPIVNVLPDYVPVHNIDLRLFPAGRFAVEDATGTLRFFIVTELKRRTRLAGRFVWTKFRYANEYLEAGDRTVREQVGDTKKFIGKQRIAQPVYFGEEEDLILKISQNPVEAMQRYGKELHKCSYCGRSLTDDLSRERGIGPDCWEDKHVPYIFSKIGVAQP